MGVLAGLRIVELAGIGPAPFCGMMLADHGAEVIQVGRIGARATPEGTDPAHAVLNRSRRRIEVNLKHPEGVAVVRALLRDADGLIEGFRPGVIERLGLDPADLLQNLNRRLVVGRMTGWGQYGPCAAEAGHDINYLAVSGTLGLLGSAGSAPTPPANLLGDFGGGGMMLAFAMVSAILAAQRTGEGQVVDCAIVDGAALLSSMIWGFRAQGRWSAPRGGNFLDGGAHYYGTYECADGRFLAVGALEQEFYAALVSRLGVDAGPLLEHRERPGQWAAMRKRLADLFLTRSRDEWTALFAGTDACVSPVVSMDEAPHHPHTTARRTFIDAGGAMQPAPAPRFSRDGERHPVPQRAETDTHAVLETAGYSRDRIVALCAQGVVA